MVADTSAPLTVVIPVWGDYCSRLPGCIESLLEQRGVEFEVLVVDNASDVPLPPLPDGVNVHRLPARVSVGAARNAGAELVRTPYVFFLDVDDRILPGTLELLAERLRRTPSAVAATCSQVAWSPDDGTTGTRRKPLPTVRWLARSRRLLALATLRFNVFPVVGCAVIPTGSFLDAGGFGDGNLGEDWALCAALAWRGRILMSKRVGRLYATWEGSLWHRSHRREDIERMYAGFQRRFGSDAALPAYARFVLRHVFGRLHTRDARRFPDARPDGRVAA